MREPTAIATEPAGGIDVLRWPGIGAFLRWRHARSSVQLALLAVAVLLVVHGLIGPELGQRQLALLTTLGLPTAAKAEWATDDMIAVMRRDKKAAGGRMRFILPTRLGDVKLFDDVPEALVRDVLAVR